MSIEKININTYKEIFGQNDAEHKKISEEIKRIITSKLISLNTVIVDVYNLCGTEHVHNAGNVKRTIIYNYATSRGAPPPQVLEGSQLINGIENNFTTFLSPKGDGLIITSENGLPLAEWNEEFFELNILFDLFKEYNTSSLKIFEFIMSEFERLVWLPKVLENSWKHTSNKERLVSMFAEASRRTRERTISQDKIMIEKWENELDVARRRIKQYADNIYQTRRRIDIEQEGLKNVNAGLVKDFDLILANDKIKDLHIEGGKFIVYTNPIYIHSDKGYRYYGGEYRIELNPENSDVKFYGGSQRPGYWTTKDPHPHINGRDGRPCLGNVASTIAELCSQMQIYALVIVCIDFLESANTSDSAGKNVVNWDLVDEDGNVIPQEKREDETMNETLLECPDCGERYREEDGTTVYDLEYDGEYEDAIENDEYELTNERMVCGICFDDYCYYNEDIEEYIRD